MGLLALSEAVSDLWQPLWGIWLHAGLVFLLIFRGSRSTTVQEQRLFLALSITPLVRIASYALSPALFPGVWYDVVTEIPLLLAAVTAVRVLRLNPSWLGLARPRHGLITLATILTGILVGLGEAQIIHPAALVFNLSWAQVAFPSLLLIVFTGFTEELAFRGLIQSTATAYLGVWPGILYTAIAWSVLHMGWSSGLDVLYVFGVGVVWGWIRYVNGSILGVVLAHGLANVVLFVVLPLLHWRF